MSDTIIWIIVGIIAAVVLGVLIYFIVKICKMKPEERKELILNFLKGAVVAAEQYIGSGHGDEKLAYVEEYFKKKAPKFLKLLLVVSGQKDLKGLIEEALEAVEGSFGKKKEKTGIEENKDKEE